MQVKLAICWSFWYFFLFTIFLYEITVNLNLATIPYPVSLAYGSLCKLVWSYVVAWLIYVCHRGYAPCKVTSFLSSSVFTILSRINLSALFMNLMVFRFRNGTFHTPFDASLLEYFFSISLPSIVAIYVFSFAFCVLVEVPTMNVAKRLLAPKRPLDERNAAREKLAVTQNGNLALQMKGFLANGSVRDHDANAS